LGRQIVRGKGGRGVRRRRDGRKETRKIEKAENSKKKGCSPRRKRNWLVA